MKSDGGERLAEVGALMKGASQTGLGLAFCKIATEADGEKIMVADHQPQEIT